MKFNFPNFSLGAGNILALGQARTGKSTLLKLIAIHFMIAGGRVLYFDIAKGAYVTTKCVSGTHIDWDNVPGKGRFAPIQTLSVSRACDFLFTLLEIEKILLTPDVKSSVMSAVKTIKTFDKTLQTISGLIPHIMNMEVKEALKQHTISEGQYPLFDATTEAINFDTNWLCIESKHTFESGKKASSCISYCFSRVEEMANGKPLLIIFDDASVAFKSEPVVAKLPVQINNLRKRMVSFAFAIHQLSDIGDELKDTLLNHCNTRLYTPNNQIHSNKTIRESYQSLGLSDCQLDLLAKSTPRKDYMIQSADGKCQLIDLMVNPGSTMQIVTGGSNISDINLFEDLAHKYEHDEAVRLYLQSKGGLNG